VGENRSAIIAPEGWVWTKKELATDLLRPGDIVYVRILPHAAGGQAASKIAAGTPTEGGQADGDLQYASLEQDSGTQAALMAVDNPSGDILALVGGRDFNLSQYDRATQAQRQTGSSFKAYVYTAALEAGYKPDSMILDGPTTFHTASGVYIPHDYENRYQGNITLLHAFADSLNIPALKLADHVGIHKVITTAHRFGVTTDIPSFLPIALGAAEVSLYEQVAAYSSFPNDGIRLTPHFVHRVTTADGEVLWDDAPDVHVSTDAKTARQMMQMFEAVTHQGTGAIVSQLKHPLGGKTGTTNDFTDAWFLGFSPSVTCGVWVGYDDRQTLGDKETGARVALPIWMSFMRTAIAGHPDETFPGEAPAVPTAAVASGGAVQQTAGKPVR
jgi:penicillin-binding protein 1A